MKKTLALILTFIMVLALVPTVAFASANARGILPRNIKIDAYEGKGFDFIEKNKLGVAFEYRGSQVGSGKVYILKDGQLKGNASDNTDKADPGIIIKDGIAYKFSHAGVLGNYTKLKDVYYNSSKEKWYYNYSSSISVDIVVADKGQINFAYEKTGENTYILNYDANGGENAPESETRVYNSLASATFTISNKKPFRNGYNFLGWSDTQNGTVKYKDGESLTLTYTSEVTEKTIYAVWEEIKPPVTIYITYNGNAGNDTVSNLPDPTTSTIPNGQYDAPFTISDKVPTRNGYDFLGWADSADAAKPQYRPGDTINVSGDTYFYAVWKATEIKPDIPNPTIDNIDGNIKVNVICTSTSDSQTYDLVADGFTYTTPTLNNGVYECTITATPSVYCAKYSAYTGIKHEEDTDYNNNNLNARTLTLKYDNNKWNPIGYVNPLPVGVKCGKDSHEEQQETTGTLIVTKTVESNDPADKNKEFNFKVTVITGPNPDPSGPPIAKSANAVKAPAVRAVDNTATKDKDDFVYENDIPTLYFTLKHGETMKISNLPVEKCTYHVEELDADGYTVTVNGKMTSSKDVALKENLTETLNFKNTRGSTPTPTPTPYNGGGGYYYPTTTPVPVIVIPPKTGDMTVWQSILHFFGIR